jgi:WbqC-like protein
MMLMTSWLDIGTQVVRASDLVIQGTQSGRLVEICRHFGAKRYLSGNAAKAYLDTKPFDWACIEVVWQGTTLIPNTGSSTGGPTCRPWISSSTWVREREGAEGKPVATNLAGASVLDRTFVCRIHERCSKYRGRRIGSEPGSAVNLSYRIGSMCAGERADGLLDRSGALFSLNEVY